MTKYKLLLAASILMIIGCSTTINPEKYLGKMGIELKGDYVIIEQNYSPAIGDLLVEFDLKLGQKDYDNVVNSIKSQSSFRILDSLESYPYGLDSYPQDVIKEYSCFRNGTYYKHLFIPEKKGHGWETYTFYLSSDSTLFFQYGDE